MFRFSDMSEYLYLLLLLTCLVSIYVIRFLRAQNQIKNSFSQRLKRYYFGSINFKNYGLYRNICFSIGSLFVVIALFRPQYGSQKLQVNAEGVEAVFVVDVSKSMAAEDVKPQRLKLAQIQLKRLTQILDGNRMGIVAFAGQVGVISPLTQDVGALNLFIDSLDFDVFTEQGTNIGFALEEARQLLNRGQTNSKNERTKVVVLVTDGEDHSGEATSAASKLKDDGIRTFVIGVGTNEGAKIPIRDKFGQTTGYLTDNAGNAVITKPNFKFLKELSNIGGGGFYKLDFGNVANQAVAKDFESLKKTKFESESFEVKGEYYQYFLSLGLILLILSLFLPSNSVIQKMGPLIEIEDTDS